MAGVGTVKYGMPSLGAGAPAAPVGAGAANGALTIKSAGSVIDSPVTWLMVILGATLGLVGASTSARVGPLRASVSAGKA